MSGANSRAARGAARGVKGKASDEVASGTNLVVLRGELRTDPERRDLASGDEVLTFDLIVRAEPGPSESVPVSWTSPGAGSDRLRAGAEVVVIGRVRRRFFRVAGATATRTEVQATGVVPVRAAATLRRALGTALAPLGVAGRR